MKQSHQYYFVGVAVSLLVAACASSPTTTERAEPSAEKGTEYPEACTIEIDRDEDGVADEYRRQVVDAEGRIVQTLTDNDADGVFDQVDLAAYGTDGQRWARRLDKGADATLENRYGEHASDDIFWLLKRQQGTMRGGEEVTDDKGRVLGHVGKSRYQGKRVPAANVRIYDDQDRHIAEWLFVATSPEAEAPDPRELRERVVFDEETRKWKVRPGPEPVTKAHLLRYGPGEIVLAEAVWAEVNADSVPSIDTIVDGVGLDEPHVLRFTGGVQAAFAPTPEDWQAHLSALVVREINDQNLMTGFWDYTGNKYSDGKALALGLSMRRFYDEEGNAIRTETTGARARNSILSEGIVGYVQEQRLEAGKVVEKTSSRVEFDPDLDPGRIGEDWRHVPLASEDGAQTDEPVEPRLTLMSREVTERDSGGNETLRRKEQRVGLQRYEYDAQGRISLLASDARDQGRFHSFRRFDGFAEYRKRHHYDAGRLARVVELYFSGHFSRAGQTTSYHYDDEGRVVREEVASWSNRSMQNGEEAEPQPFRVVEHAYDSEGRKTKSMTTSAQSNKVINTTHYAHDEAGRLIEEEVHYIGRKPTITRYHYDADGHLVTEETLANGATEPTERVEYEYDDGGVRRTARHYEKSRRRGAESSELPLSHITEYVYDEQGRLLQEHDRKHIEVTRSSYECYE